MKSQKLVTKLVLIAAFWPVLALAQLSQLPWGPNPTTNTSNPYTVTIGGGTFNLPTFSSSPPPVAVNFCNTGSNPAYVIMGATTATAGNSLVAAGICKLLALNNNTQFSAIATGGSTTLNVETGNGNPQSSLPGGGSGSGGVVPVLVANSVLATDSTPAISWVRTLPSGLTVPAPNFTGTAQLDGTNFFSSVNNAPTFYDGGANTSLVLGASGTTNGVIYLSPTSYNGLHSGVGNFTTIGEGTASNSPGSTTNAGNFMTQFFMPGSAGSPTATQNNQEVGGYQIYDYDGTGYNSGQPVGWFGVASENRTSTSTHGTAFIIQSVPNGTNTGVVEASFENGIVSTVNNGYTLGNGRGTISASYAADAYYIGAKAVLGLTGATGYVTLMDVNGINGILLPDQADTSDAFLDEDTWNIRNHSGAAYAVLSNTGVIVKGTAGPLTMASGSLGLMGTSSAPTFGANSEGAAWLTSAGGLNIGGQGSGSDLTFINKSGATVFSVPTGTANVTFAGQITAQSMTQTSAAQSGTVCNNTGGTLTYDASLGCLSSDERLKTISGNLVGATATLMKLQPVVYQWNSTAPRHDTDPGEHIGMGAFTTAYADERLISRGDDGQPRGWREDAMITLLVATVQNQQKEIEELKQRYR